MIDLRRLLAAGGVVAVAAVLTGSHVLGDSSRDKDGKAALASTGTIKSSPLDARFQDDLAASRFAEQPLVLYQTQAGEVLFGLQVKPKLPPVVAKPRDVLIVVDTSASQAEGPLASAVKLTEVLVGKLGKEDRVAIWTANVEPKNLTRGFKAPDQVNAALKSLQSEFPAGATNLKKAMTDALAAFDVEAGRQRVVALMGDGMSIAGPLDGAARAALCADLADREVGVFPVPLGDRLEPLNIHGLASGTGGKVVRVKQGEQPEATADRFLAALSVPVMYPKSIQLPDAVAEAFPTRLPPLRADAPTLVVGKLKEGAKPADFAFAVTGAVEGKEVKAEVKENVPEAELDNFFLTSIVTQWREQKDRPAIVQADRALAAAFTQNQVARNELLVKANWAVQEKHFDAADKLFQQAKQVDPQSLEAKLGLDLVQQMRDGKLTPDQLREKLRPKEGDGILHIEPGAKPERFLVKAQAAQPDPVPPLAPAAQDPGALAKEVEARRAVADQQATQIINDAVRQATRLVKTDPDGAQELLKRARDGVLTNQDLSPGAQARLSASLERALQNVVVEGRRVRRDMDERLRAVAAADARASTARLLEAAEDRIRERLRVFHNLMNQAREGEAQRQAEALRRDLIDQGLPVPQAVLAAYTIAQRGFYLRQERELERVRQERWLSVMLSVEQSHIPYSDEPPIYYPDPDWIKRITRGRFKDWAEYSEFRRKQYETAGFDAGAVPLRTLELRDQMGKQIKYGGQDLPTTTLQEELDRLANRYNLAFDINEKAFQQEMINEVSRFPIADKSAIPPMNASLSTVLRRILARIPATSGATYLIRRDTIEITTGAFATAEKVIRIYPVADLVFQPPSAFNQQAVQQQLTLFGFGGSFGLAQQAIMFGLGQFGQVGNFGVGIPGGNVGQFGNQFGNVGNVGVQMFGNVGQFGNIGMQFGQQNGQFGQVGQLGVQGQLGNLGGQFGIQGGNFSDQLVTMIRELVGTPKDWAAPYSLPGNNPQDPLADPNANPDGGQIGFYPPAMALVIKATSRIHTNLAAPPGGAGPGPLGALDRPGNGDKVVIRPGGNNQPPVKPGDAVVKKDQPKKEPAKLDPRTVWQDALAQGVDNPAIIIAVADFLAMNGYWDHATEFLKANLRQGILVKPWVYESLAIALKQSGGDPLDVERAEMSVCDLEPTDGQGYLKAAKGLAGLKRYDRAVALCRQAALVEPNVAGPYSDALVYAEQARDADALQWAAGNLVRQDWPSDNRVLQDRAVSTAKALAASFEKEAKTEEARKLLAGVNAERRRDLIIRLIWQGEADLDLKIKEPIGSICSAVNRQTVAGGVFVGDALSDDAGKEGETYRAAEAFPGDYEVTVSKVWGNVLGNRAQLKIIRNQGTSQETEELLTVDLKDFKPIKVKVDAGRRKEVAYVPPPSAQPAPTSQAAQLETHKVLVQLRNLADPEFVGVERMGYGAAAGSTGRPVAMAQPVKPRADAKDQVLYQTRVQSFVKNSLDVTAQVVLSADRRQVRVSYQPSFDTMAKTDTRPVVTTSAIPGGR